jgi:hypothetical protein
MLEVRNKKYEVRIINFGCTYTLVAKTKINTRNNCYYLAELNRIVTAQECDATILNRITKAGYQNFLSDYIG